MRPGHRVSACGAMCPRFHLQSRNGGIRSWVSLGVRRGEKGDAQPAGRAPWGDSSMRLKSQHIFVIGVVGVLALYFVVRALFGGGHSPNRALAKPTAGASAIPSVQIRLTPDEIREYDVVLRG